MTTEESFMTSFLMPITLIKEVDSYLERVSSVTMTKIPRSEYYKEAIFYFLNYLEKLNTEDEMTQTLLSPHEWVGEKSMQTFRTYKGIITAVDDIVKHVTEKAGQLVNRTDFLIKAMAWYLKDLKNKRTENAIRGIMTEGKL